MSEVEVQSDDLVATEGGSAPAYLAHSREYWSVAQATDPAIVSVWNDLVKQGGGTAVAVVLALESTTP